MYSETEIRVDLIYIKISGVGNTVFYGFWCIVFLFVHRFLYLDLRTYTCYVLSHITHNMVRYYINTAVYVYLELENICLSIFFLSLFFQKFAPKILYVLYNLYTLLQKKSIYVMICSSIHSIIADLSWSS